MPLSLQYLLPKKIYQQVAGSFALVFILILCIIALSSYLVYESEYAEDFQIRTINAAHSIHYYDEVLTMSARMAAFTGNRAWNERYQRHVNKLDQQLKEAVALYPKAASIIQSISETNVRLVEAEEKALDLAARGELDEAKALLFNPGYEENKAIYMTGLTALIQQLEGEQHKHQKAFHRLFFITAVVFVVLLAALGFIIWKIINVLIQRLEIENALAMVARRLQMPDEETIDQDIRWILSTIANKAEADYVFLIKKRSSKHAAVISEWGINNSDECDQSQYNDIIAAISQTNSATDSAAVLRLSDVLQSKGVRYLIGDMVSNGNREYYQLCIVNPKGKEFSWDKRDAAILSWFTEIIVTATGVIEKNQKLQLLAERDCLTNLLTRRKYMQLLQQQWERFHYLQTSCAVMMLDIDLFKHVNDTFGHAAGDHVLAEISAIMQYAVRDIDITGRIGGEEFSILLPGTDIDEGIIIAERIRTKIEETAINIGDQTIHITMSIGITLFCPQDKSGTTALNRADKALYQAKQGGRNQVAKIVL